jgi:hypothetical protein
MIMAGARYCDAGATEQLEDSARGTSVLEYHTKHAHIGPLVAPSPVAVSLVTQCSIDRLPRLWQQALAYGSGPISVAIYVPAASSNGEDEGDEQAAALAQILQFHSDVSRLGACLTVSLLFANPPSDVEYDNMYPINSLRNLALDAAPTSLVLLVDVDFVPSPDLTRLCSSRLCSSALERYRAMCNADSVLVVPAFEVDAGRKMPQTRAEVEVMVSDGSAEGFHLRYEDVFEFEGVLCYLTRPFCPYLISMD